MSFGTPDDLKQEGLFDKTEELTLNYEQVGALLISIQRQMEESNKTLDVLKTMTPKETIAVKMTKEDIENEIALHDQLLNSLPYLREQLIELAHQLEPEGLDKIVIPGLD